MNTGSTMLGPCLGLGCVGLGVVRISHSGSKAQYKGDTRNHVL